MSTKTFSLRCTVAILLLVAGVGLFNGIVDPYWYFREVDVIGFNHIKTHATGNERLVKPALVSKIRPDAIILGNSVAEIGLPPTHRGFTNNGKLKSYNLALPGASWNEVNCLAMFVMRWTDVKRLIIGSSGEGTGEREEACPSDTSFARPDYGKLLFSRSAVFASRETMRQQNRAADMTSEGLWLFHRNDDGQKADEEMAAVLKKALCKLVPTGEVRLDRTRLQTAAVSAHEGASLRALIRLARIRHVELVFVFYPTHVLMSEAHRACQSAEAHWNALWRLVSIVDQEGDPLRTQVWDFSGYVSMNAERFLDSKPTHEPLWREVLHFNEPVGAAALDAIYLGDPNYGDRVTAGNFEDLVARREAERSQFLRDNPWVRQEIDTIARQVADSPAKAQQ
jgi:hypothetical protein